MFKTTVFGELMVNLCMSDMRLWYEPEAMLNWFNKNKTAICDSLFFFIFSEKNEFSLASIAQFLCLLCSFGESKRLLTSHVKS